MTFIPYRGSSPGPLPGSIGMHCGSYPATRWLCGPTPRSPRTGPTHSYCRSIAARIPYSVPALRCHGIWFSGSEEAIVVSARECGLGLQSNSVSGERDGTVSRIWYRRWRILVAMTAASPDEWIASAVLAIRNQWRRRERRHDPNRDEARPIVHDGSWSRGWFRGRRRRSATWAMWVIWVVSCWCSNPELPPTDTVQRAGTGDFNEGTEERRREDPS